MENVFRFVLLTSLAGAGVAGLVLLVVVAAARRKR
jgi:hypothetical protein